MIQDWVGAVFVPRTNLRNVLSTVQDYEHNREIYRPDITDTKIRARDGDTFLIYLRIVKSKFLITDVLNDVLNTEHEIRFAGVVPRRPTAAPPAGALRKSTSPGRRPNTSCRSATTGGCAGVSTATGSSRNGTEASISRVNLSR